MPNDNLRESIDEFVNCRINEEGEHEPKVLQEATAAFFSACDALLATLTEKQVGFYDCCIHCFSEMDGEVMECYYRAGFSDAVQFLLGWRNGDWTP